MKHFVKQLRDNWVILAFIAGCIVSFTTMQNRVCAQEKAQACTISDLDSVKKTCSTQNTDIAVIKNDISTIRDFQKGQDQKLDKILYMVAKKNGL